MKNGSKIVCIVLCLLPCCHISYSYKMNAIRLMACSKKATSASGLQTFSLICEFTSVLIHFLILLDLMTFFMSCDMRVKSQTPEQIHCFGLQIGRAHV